LNYYLQMTANFLKTCIEVANQTDKLIATAAFITARLEGKTISLPLLHSECQTVIKRVSKQQELLGYYELDKAKRQIRFTELIED